MQIWIHVPLQLTANLLIHLLIYFRLGGQIYSPLNDQADCQIVDLFVNFFRHPLNPNC